MGFHVYLGTGYGFAMAGHCSYAGASDLWYLDGWPAPSGGYIGSVSKTLYKDLGQDFMVVKINTVAQRSDRIFGSARRVQGRGNPVAGETICASLGFTNTIDCGTVRSASLSWLDDNNFIIRGADHDGIATNRGDSGSPLYRLSGTSYAVAIGIHNTHDGYFTKMADAVIAAGVRIYP